MNTCLQGLGSARLQGKLQGIVYIDDIMIMIILQSLLSLVTGEMLGITYILPR